MALVTCKNCKADLNVPDRRLKESAGQIRCSYCGARLQIEPETAKSGKEPRAVSRILLLIALAGLAIGGAAATVVRSSPKPSALPRAHWVCEVCGKMSEGPLAGGFNTCPYCKRQACVRAIYYRCRKCDKSFEWAHVNHAERIVPVKSQEEAEEAAERASPVLYKTRGGDWTEQMPPLKCPACGNTHGGQFDLLRPGEGNLPTSDGGPRPESKESAPDQSGGT